MRNDHMLVRCAKTFTSMLEMDDHYHNTHKDHIPINCKICGTLLLDAWNLKKHIKWHSSKDKRTHGKDFTEMCSKCGCFYSKGEDFQYHKAHCIEKSIYVKDDYAPQSKGMGDTSVCDAAALTPEGHPSSSFLKQLIAATLRTGGSYSQNKNNAMTHHSHHPYPSQLGRKSVQ